VLESETPLLRQEVRHQAVDSNINYNVERGP